MTRVVLAAVGMAAIVFGAVKLWALGPSDLAQTVLWLAGGVVAHDAVFAPAVLFAGLTGAALLPVWARGPVTAGSVVLVSVTITVFPTLAGFGARPDLPSLLDRPYRLGWVVFAGIVVLGVAYGCVRDRRHERTASAQS